MDASRIIQEHVATLKSVQEWPALRELLFRSARLQPGHWQLPLILCEAVGGACERALPAVAALACQHIGILLIDDMLDTDPRGEYRRVGHGAAANLASAVAAAGQLAILRSQMAHAAKLVSVAELQAMNLQTALGQHLESAMPADEGSYWAVVRAKSAPFFGTAFYLGAVAGKADPATASQMRQLGGLYGELIQIHDDLKDALQVPASPDWQPGRTSLPILYAERVAHPDRKAFIRLRHQITSPGALAQAQQILVRSGAIGYGFHRLLAQTAEARCFAGALELPRPEGVELLLDEIVHPIYTLLMEIGIPRQEIGRMESQWSLNQGPAC